MLNTLPELPERDMRELELCSALVGVLQLTRGYSAPQTVEAGERVRALAEKVGNLSQLVRQEERTWEPFLPQVTMLAPLRSPTGYSTLPSARVTTQSIWCSHTTPKCRRAFTAGT